MKQKTKTAQKATGCKKYKIVIICVITAILSACATLLVANYFCSKIADSAEMLCKDNAAPNEQGCCPGETYTDMGETGFKCCPDAGGDCFPPIEKK